MSLLSHPSLWSMTPTTALSAVLVSRITPFNMFSAFSSLYFSPLHLQVPSLLEWQLHPPSCFEFWLAQVQNTQSPKEQSPHDHACSTSCARSHATTPRECILFIGRVTDAPKNAAVPLISTPYGDSDAVREVPCFRGFPHTVNICRGCSPVWVLWQACHAGMFWYSGLPG